MFFRQVSLPIGCFFCGDEIKHSLKKKIIDLFVLDCFPWLERFSLYYDALCRNRNKKKSEDVNEIFFYQALESLSAAATEMAFVA